MTSPDLIRKISIMSSKKRRVGVAFLEHPSKKKQRKKSKPTKPSVKTPKKGKKGNVPSTKVKKNFETPKKRVSSEITSQTGKGIFRAKIIILRKEQTKQA